MKNIEQVAIEHLLNNAYRSFESGLLSASGRIVLWSSFADAPQLVSHFLGAGGRTLLVSLNKEHLLDKRRRQTPGDQIVLDHIEEGARDAQEFKEWAMANPTSLTRQIYVPSRDLNDARRTIERSWSGLQPTDRPRAEIFFRSQMIPRNPDPCRFKLEAGVLDNWDMCGTSFRLRNAIVHSLARPSEQLQLGDSIFMLAGKLN